MQAEIGSSLTARIHVEAARPDLLNTAGSASTSAEA